MWFTFRHMLLVSLSFCKNIKDSSSFFSNLSLGVVATLTFTIAGFAVESKTIVLQIKSLT